VDDVLINEAEVGSWAARLARLGGVAALLGGLAWTLKGAVILAGGEQPPLLFEAAPTFFGLGLMSVAYSTMPAGRRQGIALALAAIAALSGLAALVSDVMGELADPALVISSVAVLIGLLTLGGGVRLHLWLGTSAWRWFRRSSSEACCRRSTSACWRCHWSASVLAGSVSAGPCFAQGCLAR
jgi:hypothetical protein